MPLLYTTRATATGGRDGVAVSANGSLTINMSTPRELGGTGGQGSNPEQLFAAAYATCFLSSLKFVASQGGPTVPANAAVTATVGIGPSSLGGFGLDVQLDIALPGLVPVDAGAMVNRAHLVCPYSHATRNNVPVRLIVI